MRVKIVCGVVLAHGKNVIGCSFITLVSFKHLLTYEKHRNLDNLLKFHLTF